MRASTWVLLLRAACLVALGTSVALLIDYTRPSPEFCAVDSGCGAIRASGFGYVPLFGMLIPVPLFGVLGFALLFTSSLQRNGEMRERVAAPMAYAGGVVGLGLIVLQVIQGAFCYLCMIADSCAVVAATAAYFLRSGGWDDAFNEETQRITLMDPLELMSEGQRVKGVWRDDSQIYDAPNSLVQPAPSEPFRLKLSGWITLALLATLAPIGFPLLVRSNEVPPVIRGLYEPNTTTVLEFFDFQCPHCRDLSPRLKKLTEENAGFSLRYGYTPLPHHPDAKNAARLAICAGEQGKEKDVAAAFFLENDLSEANANKVAQTLVPDAKALEACLGSKRPDERIEADTQALKTAGFVGLPTTYVGGFRVLGAHPDEEYQAAFNGVRAGKDDGGLNPLAYWGGVLLLLFAAIMMGREERSDRNSIPG